METIEQNSFINKYPFGWMLINALIPTVGLLFLDWSAIEVLFLFSFELLLTGAVLVLKIIFSMKDLEHWWDGLYGKAVTILWFTFIYGTLTLLLISFLVVSMDTDSMEGHYHGMKWSIPILMLNYLAKFLTGFILNGEQKKYAAFDAIAEGLVQLFPLCLVFAFMLPLTMKFPFLKSNIFILVLLIFLRSVIHQLINRNKGNTVNQSQQ